MLSLQPSWVFQKSIPMSASFFPHFGSLSALQITPLLSLWLSLPPTLWQPMWLCFLPAPFFLCSLPLSLPAPWNRPPQIETQTLVAGLQPGENTTRDSNPRGLDSNPAKTQLGTLHLRRPSSPFASPLPSLIQGSSPYAVFHSLEIWLYNLLILLYFTHLAIFKA